VAARAAGFAIVDSNEFGRNREIRLAKWGRIEGQVAPGREPLDNQITMMGLPNPTWLRHKREFHYQIRCRAEGKFTVDRVPAGWFEVGYLTKMGDILSSLTSRTPVEVKAGATVTMTLGGEGRPVIGRFVPPTGPSGAIYFGAGQRSLQTERPDPPRPANYDQMTKREQQWSRQWRFSPAHQAYSDSVWHDPNWRGYVFRISADGTFRIEDVIPGKYDMSVWLEERLTGRGPPEEIGGYNGTVEVPPIPGGRTEEPLDLGDLVLHLSARPLEAGTVAPPFEANDVDGRKVRLADYRGRFVLLSFWQPVSDPELDRLKELYQTYAGTGRLQIIGLAGGDTLAEVRSHIQEKKIEWPQIYLGATWDHALAREYRMPGNPYLLLVDPEGKLAATRLRGEKLTQAVRAALGPAE